MGVRARGLLELCKPMIDYDLEDQPHHQPQLPQRFTQDKYERWKNERNQLMDKTTSTTMWLCLIIAVNHNHLYSVNTWIWKVKFKLNPSCISICLNLVYLTIIMDTSKSTYNFDLYIESWIVSSKQQLWSRKLSSHVRNQNSCTEIKRGRGEDSLCSKQQPRPFQICYLRPLSLSLSPLNPIEGGFSASTTFNYTHVIFSVTCHLELPNAI